LITPDVAFGAVNEDNIQRFPRYQFPPDLVLATGLVINFADSADTSQAGVVKQFDSTWVEVDFNHPLAGRSIRFKFHIHDVQISTTSGEQ
jgi:FKBP-type peptidyl-prolyl cis-trans isomerase SlpA